jgi:hypothetical protein
MTPEQLQVVEVTDFGVDTDHLKACHLDEPTAGSCTDLDALRIVGWVLGEQSRAMEVEVIAGPAVVARAPVDVPRPGVAQSFPDYPGADAAGFDLTLEATGQGNGELRVDAIFENGTRATVGTIFVDIPRAPKPLSRFFQ